MRTFPVLIEPCRLAEVNAAHHLILGAARPVFRAALGAECFALSGQPALRIIAFQLPKVS
jgi:hypothetical protein